MLASIKSYFEKYINFITSKVRFVRCVRGSAHYFQFSLKNRISLGVKVSVIQADRCVAMSREAVPSQESKLAPVISDENAFCIFSDCICKMQLFSLSGKH